MMNVMGQFMSGSPQFRATAYNGSSYGSRGGLFAAADGDDFIFSTWLEPSGSGTELQVIDTTNLQFFLRRDTSNRLDFFAKNTAGTIVARRITSSTYTSGWHHVLVASNGSNLLFYVDDAVPSFDSETTPSGETFDFTDTNWAIGARTSGVNDWNGCLSEIYLNIAEYLDISVEANRRKFISEAGRPVPLGNDGSFPTGTRPILYVPDGNPSVNKGTGGNFGITGTLTACSGSPSL